MERGSYLRVGRDRILCYMCFHNKHAPDRHAGTNEDYDLLREPNLRHGPKHVFVNGMNPHMIPLPHVRIDRLCSYDEPYLDMRNVHHANYCPYSATCKDTHKQRA